MLSPPSPQKKRAGRSASGSAPGQNAVERYADPHIGIDEAGRGCLAGPVVAAAVLFPLNFPFEERLPGLNDSKQLGQEQRERLAGGISVQASAFGIGLSWQDEIDAVNILNATFRAMARAVRALGAALGAQALPLPFPLLLIDGNKIIPQAQWTASFEARPALPAEWERHLPLPLEAGAVTLFPLPEQRAVIDGDALVPAISAASILAKTFRDKLMSGLSRCFPEYDFARHKGYGTKAHLAAIEQWGSCALHRNTFRGVRPEEKQYRLF